MTDIDLMFRIKKFNLQYLLEKAATVIPTKDIMPVLKNFLIEASETRLDVVATDLELFVIARSDMVSVEQPGRAVFPAHKLLSVVKEAEDGELTIRVSDMTATVQVGRASWTLMLQDGSTYPDLPHESEELTKVNRAKFVRALKSVRRAAPNKTYNAQLLMVDITNGKMRASDGVRYQEVPVDCPDLQIPLNAVDDLVKILAASQAPEFEIRQNDDQLIFHISGDMFVANKAAANFPDMDAAVLKPVLGNDMELVVARDDLVSAIKRVRITANPETAAVALNLTKNKLTINSRDKHGSAAEEAVDVAWDHSAKMLAFNHEHLLEMLDMGDMKTCHFWLGVDQKKTRPSALLLKDEETGLVGVLNQVRADWLD